MKFQIQCYIITRYITKIGNTKHDLNILNVYFVYFYRIADEKASEFWGFNKFNKLCFYSKFCTVHLLLKIRLASGIWIATTKQYKNTIKYEIYLHKQQSEPQY